MNYEYVCDAVWYQRIIMSLSDSTLGYPGGGGGGGGVNKTRHLPSSRPPFLTPERQHPPIINLTIIDPPESTLGEIFCPWHNFVFKA